MRAWSTKALAKIVLGLVEMLADRAFKQASSCTELYALWCDRGAVVLCADTLWTDKKKSFLGILCDIQQLSS